MSQPNVLENFISPQTAKYLNAYLKSRSEMNPRGLLNVYLKPIRLN